MEQTSELKLKYVMPTIPVPVSSQTPIVTSKTRKPTSESLYRIYSKEMTKLSNELTDYKQRMKDKGLTGNSSRCLVLKIVAGYVYLLHQFTKSQSKDTNPYTMDDTTTLDYLNYYANTFEKLKNDDKKPYYQLLASSIQQKNANFTIIVNCLNIISKKMQPIVKKVVQQKTIVSTINPIQKVDMPDIKLNSGNLSTIIPQIVNTNEKITSYLETFNPETINHDISDDVE